MGAARDVQIERLLYLEVFVQKACESQRVSFGIRCGKTATFVACAGNRRSRKRASGIFKTSSCDSLPRSFEFPGWDIREDQILPNGKANLSRTVLIGNAGDGAHLGNAQ